ncbi:MAG: hypothetical protein K8R67_18620 [Desulfobacteraceae bacterium]|nr:hypothetical protein [Desulfobacteraceae bacterium]
MKPYRIKELKLVDAKSLYPNPAIKDTAIGIKIINNLSVFVGTLSLDVFTILFHHITFSSRVAGVSRKLVRDNKNC